MTSSVDNARELALLTDILLPGDDLFPSASAVGAHGLLAERLRERLGARAVGEVIDAVGVAADRASLGDLDEEQRIAAVRRFEEAEPGLFATIRGTLYFSYYQSPLVVAAIRQLDIAYNDAPQPSGYTMEPFDATPGMDAPLHPLGWYKRTEEMARIVPGPTSDG